MYISKNPAKTRPLSAIPNHKVGEYRDARKLFQTEDLDPNDFPSEVEE